MPKSVSVIIPSFNRGHLLPITLPTYLQENVIELILVDDCSSDNTISVVKELQAKYPQIHYFRNEVNSKQTFSKNVGIENAKGEYIYFGDDDSVITKDAIAIFLETLQKHSVDVCGARPLAAGNYLALNDLNSFIHWRSVKSYAKREQEICDFSKMKFKFGMNYKEAISIPVYANACALLKTEVAKQFRFDCNYIGCAYREEMDYWTQIALAGYKFMFNPKAVQLNLPIKMVKLTGARSGGFDKWKESAKFCNKYFLDKNWGSIQKKFGYTATIEELQREFEESVDVKKDFSERSSLKDF